MLSSRFSSTLLSRAQFTTIPTLSHRPSSNISKKSFIIHPCRIAVDRLACPEDIPLSFSSKGTILKDFINSTSAGQARKASLDCVQCVEGFQTDSMNHCVPEWDGSGRELDSMWDPADSISPKGKWDTGQTKRSDMAFVPEYDFEELCWEDGELLIVMQGQNNKGNAKIRNGGQSGTGEPAPVSSGMQATTMDNSVVTPGSVELTFPSALNIHNQEDDLLAWLQHTSDELGDKLDMSLDGSAPNGSWTTYDRLCSNTIVHHENMKSSALNEEEPGPGSSSRSLKHDTPHTHGNKVSYDHLDNPPHCLTSDLSGLRTSPSMVKSSKDPIENTVVVHRNDMPPPQTHSGMAGCAYGSVSMNFSNFSRPAATYKASLHSIGMASGPSGAERLKQLDKIAGDKLKEESIDSTKKHFKSISPTREEDAPFQTVPNASQNVEASVIQQNTGSYSLWSEVDADISANEALNGSSRVVGKSNGWDSSIISSTALRTTDILGTVDRSDTFSSGGSEDFDVVDRKGSVKMTKRKFYEEDSDIQSKTLQSESTSTKKTATGEEISMKRRRVAENHNQSERRRRDRISEKMRALQALIPNSHKSDKASMLEEAISYIKALKAQLQMMSHRGSGVYFSPMLIPHGMQPMQMAAWPHMAMGMGMGMGMNIGTTGMGMLNMNMSGGPNVRQYAPLLPVPASGISAVNANPATSMDSTNPNTTHGMFVKHGFLSPAYPMMMPAQPGNPNSSTCETLPTPNISAYKILPLQQQQQSVEALTQLPQ